MLKKYILGFLLASIIQAAFVFITEFFNISNLNMKASFGQLIIHLLVGQLFGFITIYIIKIFDAWKKFNPIIIGLILGTFTYLIIIPINVGLNKLNNPINENFATFLSSLLAFLLYGLIVSYTIKYND